MKISNPLFDYNIIKKLPYDEDAAETLSKFVDVLIEDMQKQISEGREGPTKIDKEFIIEGIKKGTVIVLFTVSNPPRPQIVFFPDE